MVHYINMFNHQFIMCCELHWPWLYAKNKYLVKLIIEMKMNSAHIHIHRRKYFKLNNNIICYKIENGYRIELVLLFFLNQNIWGLKILTRNWKKPIFLYSFVCPEMFALWNIVNIWSSILSIQAKTIFLFKIWCYW